MPVPASASRIPPSVRTCPTAWASRAWAAPFFIEWAARGREGPRGPKNVESCGGGESGHGPTILRDRRAFPVRRCSAQARAAGRGRTPPAAPRRAGTVAQALHVARTSSSALSSSTAERAREISRPTCVISASFMPRVVRAGVPTRMPDATMGEFVSKGIVFLLTVMPARSSAFSATLPVMPGRTRRSA